MKTLKSTLAFSERRTSHINWKPSYANVDTVFQAWISSEFQRPVTDLARSGTCFLKSLPIAPMVECQRMS